MAARRLYGGSYCHCTVAVQLLCSHYTEYAVNIPSHGPLFTFATSVAAELLGMLAVITTLPAATVSVICEAAHPADAAISRFILSCTELV